MPKFTGAGRGGFQITSTNLKVVTLSTKLALQVTDTSKKYINTTDHLGFLLREYDERSLVYAIVLEFFTQTGGVY